MRSTIISVTIAAGMGLSVVAGAVASTSSFSSQPVAPESDVKLTGYHYKGGGHKKRWGHAHRHCHGWGCHYVWHWHWGHGGGHHGNWSKWH